MRKKTVTIVSSFTGRWSCIYQFLKSLLELDISGLDVNLEFYDNSCNKDFGELLQAFLNDNRRKYKKIHYVVDQSAPITTSTKMKDKAIERILNNSKQWIENPNYVLLLEDDTTVPSDGLKKLIFDIEHEKKAGIVQGVEVGRHNPNYVGVTRITEKFSYPEDPNNPNPIYEFNGCMLVDEIGEGVQEIGGGGFYFTLFRGDLFKKIDFEADIDPMNYSADVIVGPKVRRMGWKWYVDWSVFCTHYTVNKEDLRTIELPSKPRGYKNEATE